ncbi:MAG: hypothetical protein M0027_09310 [Candidatus Dormibacteraeota bacterium]|nr:hypothetical protein [Candidatus Dormibacteraeota bacterium]
MASFQTVYQDRVAGELTCLDRVILKGHLNGLYPQGSFKAFLNSQGVRLVDFASYVNRVSTDLKAHAQQLAADAGRPYEYLQGTMTKATGHSKEDHVRQLAAQDGVTQGLVAVLATVEPCRSFGVRGNRQTHRLEVVRCPRKCLFFYFYFLDPRLGLIHVRLQSWFPFEIQIWFNGHYALAQALDRHGIGYRMYANSFTQVDDLELAQQLADRRWLTSLSALAERVNPMLPVLEQAGFGPYYWSLDQSEVSTDVLFTSRPALEQVTPELFQHATTTFSSEDILRFLGRKPHPALQAEVGTSTRHRQEGWRVKHRLGRNSIKVYDKGPCLRVETTINDPTALRAWRTTEHVTGSGRRRHLVRRRQLAPVRKGIANLRTIYQAGRAANQRYLDALATAATHGTAVRQLDRLCRPCGHGHRRHASFSPLAPHDLAIFRAVLAGENTLIGFANRDLARRLYPKPARDPAEARRRCAATSRLIAKLRGHGLVRKLPRRRRYRSTAFGRNLLTAVLTIHDRDIPNAMAA